MNIKGLVVLGGFVAMTGCASTTVLHSIPEGARVMDGTKELGKTPYTITDSESWLIGKAPKVTLKHDGFKDATVEVKRDVYVTPLNIVGLCLCFPTFAFSPGYPAALAVDLATGKAIEYVKPEEVPSTMGGPAAAK